MAKILIVEDDHTMAEHLSIYLTGAGHNIVGLTDNGKSAIDMTSELMPDLIIMDIILKDAMDGIEAAEVIRSTHNKPVLYLTGNNEKAQFARAMSTEPFAYLLKPFKEEELILTVEMALYRHELETRAKRSERHLREAQAIGSIGSWEWDIINDTLHWSDQIYRIFGTEPQSFDATYEAFLNFIKSDDRQDVKDAVNAAINNVEKYNIEHRIIRPDGQEFWVHERAKVTFNEEGEAILMVGSVHDITDRKRAQETIEKLAYMDMVSDMPNRNMFYDRLKRALARVKRYDKGLAVLLIDLDGFKAVNDTFGHLVGDHLLAEVGKVLKNSIRETDTAARIGGDEFCIILPGVMSKRDVSIVAENIVSKLSEPMKVDNNIVRIGASVGIAFWQDEIEDGDALVRRADQAMYEAKSSGKSCYRFYEAKT